MTKLLPVIHFEDDATTLRNAEIAAEASADGIFLIDMGGNDTNIIEPATMLREQFPDLMIGINFLILPPQFSIKTAKERGLHAVWVDNPGVYGDRLEGTSAAIQAALTEHAPGGEIMLFGSVAFKTQGYEPDPAGAALRAATLGWIATTSGIKTGTAPDIEKLRTMKAAIGNKPLAVASGIGPDNAPGLLPYVDWVLASTKISMDFANFDPGLTKRLTDLCHAV